MKRDKQSEADLARQIVTWLHDQQYETWEEVKVYDRRIDIVARRGPAIMAIECKMSLSLEVLGQASYWNGYAHQSYAAVPNTFRRRGAMHAVCSALGVGILTVGYHDVQCQHHAPFIRRANTETIVKRLNDGNRSGGGYAAAGSAGGGYWSPWQQTCKELRRIVNGKPGIALKDALGAISHHYSSDACARSSISQWLRLGKIAGIEARKEGRALRLYVTTEQPTQC